MRNNDQTWRARTNATGDYIVAVPAAGKYVVTATKEGIGSDRTKVAVQRSGLVTANLTLWKPAADCRNRAELRTGRIHRRVRAQWTGGRRRSGAGSITRLARGRAPAYTRAAATRRRSKSARWPSARSRSAAARRQRARGVLAAGAGRARSSIQAARSVQRDQAIFSIYDRTIHVGRPQRRFYGNEPLRANDLLRRGAVLPCRYRDLRAGESQPLSARRGRRPERLAGGIVALGGRAALLDGIMPSPAERRRRAALVSRGVCASVPRGESCGARDASESRPRDVFPRKSELFFDSAYLHQRAVVTAQYRHRSQQLRAERRQRGGRLPRLASSSAPSDFFARRWCWRLTDADARVRLGHTLGELGRHKEAAAELRPAIAAKPDRRRLYLAELFLGRAEQALGRRDRSQNGITNRRPSCIPTAQSPQLALSRLARQTGDRASAQRVAW